MSMSTSTMMKTRNRQMPPPDPPFVPSCLSASVPSASTTRPVQRLEAGRSRRQDDCIVVEEPLEIRIGDEPIAVTMRTPGHDRDLAAGFCLTEGIVGDGDDLESIEPCAEAAHGNVVAVTLSEEAATRRAGHVAAARRDLYLSSSCGLCGKKTIDRIEQVIRPIRGRFQVDAATLAALPDAMRRSQAAFEQTGGLHAAVIFDRDGHLRVLREDVGRHNAVDKAIGHQLLIGRVPLDPAVLLISGRASFEIMQKAAVAGLPFVCAVSAPSSLAVDFAVRTGMTLVGFLRPGRMNVYHDEGRIVE